MSKATDEKGDPCASGHRVAGLVTKDEIAEFTCEVCGEVMRHEPPAMHAGEPTLYRVDQSGKHPEDPRADEWLPAGELWGGLFDSTFNLVNGICAYLQWLAKRDVQTRHIFDTDHEVVATVKFVFFPRMDDGKVDIMDDHQVGMLDFILKSPVGEARYRVTHL